MLPEDLALIQDPDTAQYIRRLMPRYRRSVGILDVAIPSRYGPHDPRRQAIRRIVRELADMPDAEWPAFPDYVTS